MQGMARKYRKFSPEFRDEAVRLVIDGSRPIAQVARELGVNEGTLGNWVNHYRKEHAAMSLRSARMSGSSWPRPSANFANSAWRTNS